MVETACRNMPSVPVLTVFFIWAFQLIDGQGVSHVIVTPQLVAVGGHFTVSCDASRAGVPEIASTVSSLTLGWTDGRSPPTEYSRYGILSPYNFTNPPPSRNWTFEFTGSLQGTSDRPLNRDTMRIEMVVHDPKLADTGFYICGASYFFWEDEEIYVYQYQHITIDVNGGISNAAFAVLGAAAVVSNVMFLVCVVYFKLGCKRVDKTCIVPFNVW